MSSHLTHKIKTEEALSSQKGTLWSYARQLAELTPASRNRYVDFLRAMSILAVVFGHWIMAAPYYEAGKPQMWHLLAVSSWSQWLTWLFQVMPIFFFVGGFSNFSSWETSRNRNLGYSLWLGIRLKRLLNPVLPLLGLWIVLALAGRAAGVPQGFIQVGSRIALVPTWFLSVYIMVVIFVPLTYAAWKRYRLWTVVWLMVGAVVVDAGFFVAEWRLLGWFNYLFVWLALHQLGYAWRDGLFAYPWKSLLLFPVGFCLLLIMVRWGPYPLSLVGVPTDEISNTLPPKLPLLALGIAQIGLLMAVQGIIRGWLDRVLPWTCTVFVNGMIMTIFLWHSTAMMLIIGCCFFFTPDVFGVVPGSLGWWAVRPLWVLAFVITTVPFLLAFSRFEQSRSSRIRKPVGILRLILGALLACAGLGYLAMKGIGGGPHWLYDAVSLSLPFLGAECAGFGLGRKIIRTEKGQKSVFEKES